MTITAVSSGQDKSFETDDKFKALFTPLMDESDRGCALVAAAMLDTALEQLLTAHFVNDRSVVQNILDQMRPLGTFSARIDVAYLLGLIPRNAHRELHLIRKIRNKFGHAMQPLSFDDPLIKPLTLEFEFGLFPDLPARFNFMQSALYLTGYLHGAESKMEHIVAKANIDVEEERKKGLASFSTAKL